MCMGNLHGVYFGDFIDARKLLLFVVIESKGEMKVMVGMVGIEPTLP